MHFVTLGTKSDGIESRKGLKMTSTRIDRSVPKNNAARYHDGMQLVWKEKFEERKIQAEMGSLQLNTTMELKRANHI